MIVIDAAIPADFSIVVKEQEKNTISKYQHLKLESQKLQAIKIMPIVIGALHS